MKNIILFVLLLISLKGLSQSTEDTTKYFKYPNTYGVKYTDIWAEGIMRIPDTIVKKPQSGVPGAIGRNTTGTKLFMWDGTAWMNITGSGNTIDTIFSVVINADTIYSVIIRSDTVYSNIIHSDSVYSIVVRTDTIFSNTIHTDSVYSITSHSDTLIVLNNLIIPVRDTGDYADPHHGSITFQPSDNNYYGWNGTRWLCFSCALNCYRDILISSSQFSTATICTDISIKGLIYAIMWSDVPAYIYDSVDWVHNSNGFEMLIPNFNATDSNYNFHIYTVDTSGSCSDAVTLTIGGSGGGPTYNFVTPLHVTGNNVTIDNAGADGSTKGAAGFNSNDFDAVNGIISLDNVHAQIAGSSQNGLMSAAQYIAFNHLLAHYITQTITPANSVTINVNNGYKALLLLNRDTTTIAFLNATSGDDGIISLTQDGSGNRSIKLPTNSIVPIGFGGGRYLYLTTTGGVDDDAYWWYDGTNYHWAIAKKLQ